MGTMEEVLGKLNQLLAGGMVDSNLFQGLVNRYNALCEQQTVKMEVLPVGIHKVIHLGIVLMDFEMHTEEKREEFRLLKQENIILQNFELAAKMRDEEKECIAYQAFKIQHGLEQSAFILLQGSLIYAYFGTARNDQMIRGILEKGES